MREQVPTLHLRLPCLWRRPRPSPLAGRRPAIAFPQVRAPGGPRDCLWSEGGSLTRTCALSRLLLRGASSRGEGHPRARMPGRPAGRTTSPRSNPPAKSTSRTSERALSPRSRPTGSNTSRRSLTCTRSVVTHNGSSSAIALGTEPAQARTRGSARRASGAYLLTSATLTSRTGRARSTSRCPFAEYHDLEGAFGRPASGSCGRRNTPLIRELSMLFSSRMVSEVVQPFWAALQRGEFITGAAESVGSYRVQGRRWIVAAGGVRPRRGRDLKGRYLSFSEREEIAVARAAGESVRCIARRLGRSPSTVSRELARNADRGGEYRATTAHAQAWERACRPKPAKLHVNGRLREIVQRDLERKYSPEQIAGRLRLAFPDDSEMRVSAETIYQSLYVSSRGALRRELAACCGPAARCVSRARGRRRATGRRT